MAAEFRLLGEIEMLVAGRVVPIGHARQRAVLVTLLIEANRPVPVDLLVDRVWAGHRLPGDPLNALRTYISLLRRTLRASAGVDIVRQSGGYRLTADPAAVDLHQFHRHLRQGRDTTSDTTAAAHLEAALRLWRGEPFAGLDTAWVGTIRAGLAEQRRAARLDLADVRLRLGGHAELVAELSDQVAENPLDERAAGQLMTALYRCGRQADALARYEQIRRRLADELGAVPGEPLQHLHRAVLVADPRLRVPIRAGGVPAQLPADVPAFCGRTAELAVLDHLTEPDATGTTAIVISAISGTAGVGKTALAVHWAHRVHGRFPDGQLYVNMRGYDPEQPLPVADALARFLHALGVPDREIPPGVDERSARYRTEVAGRRMLIVLDNVATVEQARPLLPGTGTGAVVVTSRDSLAGLVAMHGARRLELDLLPPGDAHALLHRLIGARVEAEAGAATALADLCARLPLALRVAAELVISHPATALADLVDELADRQQRLELLDAGGDPRAAVTAVFSWSIQHLTPDAGRVFRLLGLHPGPDVDAYTVAALADTGLMRARRDLDTLARAHLVHATAPARYGMHDLLRAYAIQLAHAEDTEADREAALGRLIAYYVATAASAMDRLHPADADRRPRVPPATTPVPDLSGVDTARTWLDTERPGLVAVAANAAHLSPILFRYLDGGHYHDALAVHTHAYDAACRAGDLVGQGHALVGIGQAHMWLGRTGPAADHLRRAIARYRQARDRAGEARTLTYLGKIERRLGHYDSAAAHLEQAVALSQQADDHDGQARALDGLGIVETLLGRHELAAGRHEQAVTLYRRAGDRTGEASALNNLGLVEQRLGRHPAAAEHHEQAVILFRQHGDRTGEANSLDSLGIAHLRLDRPDEAVKYFKHALTVFEEIGEREGQAWALNGLGEAAHALGRAADALAHHTAALAVTTDIGEPDQEARAHAGLGHAHRALGEPALAGEHYERALVRYTELKSFEADAVRAYLAAVRSPAG